MAHRCPIASAGWSQTGKLTCREASAARGLGTPIAELPEWLRRSPNWAIRAYPPTGAYLAPNATRRRSCSCRRFLPPLRGDPPDGSGDLRPLTPWLGCRAIEGRARPARSPGASPLLGEDCGGGQVDAVVRHDVAKHQVGRRLRLVVVAGFCVAVESGVDIQVCFRGLRGRPSRRASDGSWWVRCRRGRGRRCGPGRVGRWWRSRARRAGGRMPRADAPALHRRGVGRSAPRRRRCRGRSTGRRS